MSSAAEFPGDAEAEAEQNAKADAMSKHADEVHGFAWLFCPACKAVEIGGGAPGCKTCDGHGIVFTIERPERCGPDCPLDMGPAPAPKGQG